MLNTHQKEENKSKINPVKHWKFPQNLCTMCHLDWLLDQKQDPHNYDSVEKRFTWITWINFLISVLLLLWVWLVLLQDQSFCVAMK